MTIINKSITFQGALTTVTSITIYPQTGGGYIVTANGVASDGAGNTEPISVSASFPSGTTVLDNVSATALQKLRQANGLEV
jgi:hypothetical protein